MKNVLSAPLRQIAEHAGKDGPVIIDKVLSAKEGIGYNAATDEFVNMVEDGIIDPKNVVRSAIENAASVASTFLTMEAAISDIPEKEKSDSPDLSGAMPGMM